MRVSSTTIFDSNVASMNQQQARILQTQQQIASGRRILTAADDPVAAVQVMATNQLDATNTQYTLNRTMVRNTLSLAENNLTNATNLLQDVQAAVVHAGAGTLSDSDRQTIAAELNGKLQELMGLANSTDGAGNYLFAGFQSRAAPFTVTPTGVAYVGDDGQHNIQVSSTQQMASSGSGADIFMRVKNGNGTFVTNAPATNTGSGVIGSGSITNPAALVPGNSYSISFSMVAGVLNYAVTGAPTALGAPVTGPFVAGQSIGFNGIQVDIRGTPAVTDTFTVAPSSNESVFKTIADLSTALNTLPAGAGLTNSLSKGLNNLDKALNTVLTTRSSLGLRLNEVDALQTTGESLSVQFKQTLSRLQDTDYNKAISDLTQQQIGLQAAQKSFTKVAELSLFSYI